MKNILIRFNKLISLALLASLIFGINACRSTFDSTPSYGIVLAALTDNNTILTVNSDNPGLPLSSVALTGLAVGEKMLGIDYRPATGQLYGVSSASRVFVINPQTGVARPIGTSAFTPAVNGTIVGLDFNPTVDRIRMETNTGQNLRLNPETGATAATDVNLNPGTPAISEVAYANNSAGVTTTTLFAIDVNTDKLYIQNPPNNGTLVEVGSLGVDASGGAGFDITDNDLAFAALTVAGANNLYVVNLSTGRVLKTGFSSFGSKIIGLAIPTKKVAYVVDGNNVLQIFNPNNPTPIAKTITGLQSGENILGIDMRPANGQLYALGSTSRLYTINMSNGAATAVGTGPFTTPLSGTDFGFDFNPTVDRIRIVSNTGQNLRAHPDLGTIAFVDGNINPSNSSVSAAAYTNNFAGATTTTLYVLDVVNRKLYIQTPPNNGTLQFVANLQSNFSTFNGFDIGGTSGIAYAALSDEKGTKLYQINLTNGQTSFETNLNNITTVRGFTMGLGF